MGQTETNQQNRRSAIENAGQILAAAEPGSLEHGMDEKLLKKNRPYTSYVKH